MLKTKVISWILVTMLLIGVPVMASAAVLDPYDLADLVEADGSNDKLYITFPEDDFYWLRYADGNLGGVGHGNPFQFDVQMRWVDNNVVYFYPFGKDNFFPAEGLSNNALFNYSFRFFLTCTNQTQEFTAIGKLYLYARYKDGTTGSILADELDGTKTVNQSSIAFLFTRAGKAIDLTNVESFNFYFAVDFNGVANENDTTSVTVGCDGYFRLIFSLSAYYREVAAAGKTNALIQEVQTQLGEQGQTLDDILKQQEANGGKLDDMNQNIESLPGEIGDQMQDIVDNEKNEANNKGNEFVDQILDALPDPSTKVLASLKSLTDATSYTGTDAKLQIPGIVLPAVGMLIPETELWEGTQLDMGSYMELLPGTLVTVVQSLFTIAIVLYCVYELIGLIGFCLTLRGGDS